MASRMWQSGKTLSIKPTRLTLLKTSEPQPRPQQSLVQDARRPEPQTQEATSSEMPESEQQALFIARSCYQSGSRLGFDHLIRASSTSPR